jgi:hypothetical protein
MILLDAAPQYVEMNVFVTVVLALFGLIIGTFIILASKISNLRDNISVTVKDVAISMKDVDNRLIVAEQKNLGDDRGITILFSKVDSLEKERVRDVIQFTEMLSKLNNTLGKMEVTMENNNVIMTDLKNNMLIQNEEINKLKYKDKG